MPRFSGEYTETFTLNHPIERCKAHFADLETIAKHYGALDSHTIADGEITFVLEPKSEKGVTFNGKYRAVYEFTSDDVLEWRTVETKNMWSTGRARFTALGDDRTRVEFRQHVETDMEVNRLLAKVIKPIVTREINAGTRGYLDRMRAAL